MLLIAFGRSTAALTNHLVYVPGRLSKAAIRRPIRGQTFRLLGSLTARVAISPGPPSTAVPADWYLSIPGEP